ncbi:hypothetical protein AB5I41_31510 [Sphingomonas sp. MMS24-JH45]
MTPYNAALAAVTKAFTLAVTDVSDGSTDPMTTQFAAWHATGEQHRALDAGLWLTGSAITYRGDSNGIAMASSGGMALLFRQDGDTVEQRIQFKISTASVSNGNVIVLMVDAANYIGIGGWATKTLTLRKVVAGSNTARPSPSPRITRISRADKISLQIRNVNGVYTLEASVNDVPMTLASGSADVTALVTGGGALAAGRRAGLAARLLQVTPWILAPSTMRRSRVRSPTLGDPKPLTWKTGPPATPAAGPTARTTSSNRTPLSSISLGTVSPAPTAGNFLADGDTIRAQGGVPSGTYTVPVIETQTDGSVASPTTKSTPRRGSFRDADYASRCSRARRAVAPPGSLRGGGRHVRPQ